MNTYYKATRLDGTSFYDARTAWRVGRITRLDGSAGSELCAAGLLHASTEPGESLVGGSWPCRLFAVEPRSALVTSPEHPHKVGATAWKVVAELPAWQAFGPNGEAVVWLIERCSALTADEITQLVAALYAARAVTLYVTLYAALYAAWDAVRDAVRDAALYAVRDAVRDAALYAVLAFVTWDLATEDGPYTIAHRDLLVAPWRDVIGLPAALDTGRGDG